MVTLVPDRGIKMLLEVSPFTHQSASCGTAELVALGTLVSISTLARHAQRQVSLEKGTRPHHTATLPDEATGLAPAVSPGIPLAVGR